MYDVLGDSQGNTGLSRGVCGALCLGVRCWGFPGEYLSDWWCAGALFLGERSCFRGFYDIFLSRMSKIHFPDAHCTQCRPSLSNMGKSSVGLK